MTREEALSIMNVIVHMLEPQYDTDRIEDAVEMAIKALEQEPKTGWNNHQIACMLADLFGDACACNYNGIDEWLSELCDFKDTCCPNPVGVACWEQFLKYSQSRYTECGYEVRDKNALQEPKTGHWKSFTHNAYHGIDDDGEPIWREIKVYHCNLCNRRTVIKENYCPNCGAKMVKPQGSEGRDERIYETNRNP